MSAEGTGRAGTGATGWSDKGPIGTEPRVVLIGKPGCHLCDTARDIVASVTAELGVAWREISILDDVQLAERYAEQIPVVMVDGEPHDYWRVDERRLKKALARRPWWRRR